jgi:hypothetical protein
VLGTLAAASGVNLLLYLVPALRARAEGLSALAALGLFLASHLLVPPRGEDPALQVSQAAADAVRARVGESLLLGSYWDTYLVGALDPSRRLRPVAVEGDYQRTPFWVPQLREAERVLVVFSEGTSVGTAEHPDPWLLQYGVPYELEEPRWAVDSRFTFARYRNVRALQVPLRQESAKGFTPCEPGATVTLRFEHPVEQGLLLLSTNAPENGARVSTPQEAEVRVEALPNLWLIHLRSAAMPLGEVTLRTGPDARPENCWYRGTTLLLPASSSPPSPR